MRPPFSVGSTLILLTLAALSLGSCESGLEPSSPDIRTAATVRFVALEGGFFGLVGEDGGRYDPINLSREFQQDGLRVRVVLKLRADVVTVHMWGTVVEIRSIERL